MLAKKCLLVGILVLFSVGLAIADPPAVHPTTGEPLVIDCLRGTPDAIDGDLSDWNLEAMTPAVLDVVEQLFTGQESWTGPDDCSGEFYVMWDDVNVYMAVVVKDDKLSMNKTGGDIWNADAVEIFFATTNAVAGHDEHYQYGLNANNQRWNWCNIDGAGSIEPDYLQIASSLTDDGYICEASIAYAQMPSLDWSVGNAIGLHPVLDDTDNGDRELQMTWTGREAHDQSLGYGHMILSADSVPEPEETNPVGWWPLNEGAGDIALDLSDSGNDGTIHRADSGGLGTDGSVWFMDPDHGMVVSFNGDDSTGAYITTDLIIPALGLTNDFTWAFWAKQHADQETNNDTILGNRYGGTQSPLQFCKFTPTRFEFYNDDGNYEQGINYDPVPSDVWVHHAVVKDGADLTYYRNGEVAVTNTLTKTMDENPFYMGGDGQPAELWKGYLSDVRLYNRALSKLEILAAMKRIERIDIEIGFALQPPVIDGEVDYAWEGASTQSFVPLEDPADGSGIWKVLYDEENLYVIVDVTDDSLQNDSASSWQDDSVEIYFDGGNTKLSTALSGDDHQYTFGWTADDIQGTNITGYTEGIEQAQVTTDTGWRIEIKMPWLSIQGVAPLAGDLIGIDCYYNDDDDGGDSREGKMLSLSAEEFWNNASGWGTAILASIPEPVDPGTDGLMAYYALDNDVLDSSGNGNDGIITDNPDFVDPTWIDGIEGGALEIHGDVTVYGSADHVQVPSSDSLDIAGPISIALWIRPDAENPEDQGSETAPMAKALSGVSPWNWQVRYGWGGPTPYMSFTFNTSPRAWASVGQNLTQGEWAHIACSHDGETLKCYLNGAETDSTPMGAIATGEAPVLIGSDGWGCDWIGAIDEVRIYDVGLSNGEILYLAGERADGGDPSLSIYYTFDEISDVVADQSGKGHDGVIVGEVSAEIEGMIAGAAKFANAGYLDLDGLNFTLEDIPTTGMTLAAWIKCENNGEHHAIFNARASDQTWIVHPEARSNGEFRWLLRSYGGTTMFDIRAGAVTWDEWLHFAGTYDEATAKAALSINGEQVAEVDVANPADIAGDWGLGARVGKNIDDARPFTGLMDEFHLLKRALSQDEILDMMAGM